MNAIELRVQKEWSSYCKESGMISEELVMDYLDGCCQEEYRVFVNNKKIYLYASEPRGWLYGIFRLIEKCRLNNNQLMDWNITVKPYSKLRMLWSWGRINGMYRHVPFSNIRSMINIESMRDPENDPEMMRFLRHAASMGINALAITHELHHLEIDKFDQHGFRPYYKEIQAFCVYLKQWGIDLYLYTAAAPEKDWWTRTGKRDCPFDPDVRTFTNNVVKELTEKIPDMKGLFIASGLGGYAGGHLFDCDCPYCRGKTRIERVREQVRVYSDALAAHNKNLVYTVTTDHPFMMDREVDTILDMAENAPKNTILSFKDCFHDFEELRYPEHPAFSRLFQENKKNCRNLAVEYQLFPEMRGKESVLSNISMRFKEIFGMAAQCGIQNMIGIIETHPVDHHPSMADWYTFGRLAQNLLESIEDLLYCWGCLNYPEETVNTLIHVLKKSFFAAGKILYAAGVQCGLHGMIIPTPQYTCAIMNDTWCGISKKPFGFLGNDDRLGEVYSPERKQQLQKRSDLELFLHMVPVDETLKDRLLKEKTEGIQLYDEIYEKWKQAGTLFEGDHEGYDSLLRMMEKNCHDARRFRAYLEAFLNWQMGTMTEERIEKWRQRYIGTGETCSIHTCDKLFAAFLNSMSRLMKNPNEIHQFWELPCYTTEEAEQF